MAGNKKVEQNFTLKPIQNYLFQLSSARGMVLDRGSGLVGELALRQAETSSRSVVAETRLPASEPGQRWRRGGDTSANVATRWRRWSRKTSRADTGNRARIARRIPGGGKAEEGSDIGQG
jgi:hypothetical protein